MRLHNTLLLMQSDYAASKCVISRRIILNYDLPVRLAIMSYLDLSSNSD